MWRLRVNIYNKYLVQFLLIPWRAVVTRYLRGVYIYNEYI